MRPIIFVLAAAVAASAQDDARARKEAALGAQLAKQIQQRTTAIENPAVLNYLDRIGRRLADGNRVYTFALIADDAGGKTHEPLSLPGGYIFVSAGLIQSATSEAEVAGMLAHAMAHVTASRPQVGNGTIPIVFIGGSQGLVPTSVRKTQRGNETRADAMAVQTMSAAGYDPEALPSYLARVQPPPERTAKVLAALPDRDARIAALREVIAQLPARAYASPDSEEFHRMQEQVPVSTLDLVPPTLRRQN